jgi:Tol biopolymer transport system component
MTAQRLERDLPAILDDLGRSTYPDYIDDVLATTAQRRQRPAWTFPERWLPMDITTRAVPGARAPWRPLAILALIAILVAATLAIYSGTQQQRLPAPFGPAANGSIAFARSGDIHVGDPVTGETQLLIGGPEIDVFPEVSRDGTKVIFGREVGEDFELWVVRTDGSGLREVTDEPLGGAQMGAWSADGREYYQTHVVDGVQVIDAFDVVGDAEPRRLATNVADTIQVRPPDGREIAFRSLVDGMFGIAAVDVETGAVRDLIEPTVPAELDQVFLNFSYTPNGDRLFYQHGSPEGNQYTPDDACCRLWVMNADGTDQREFRDLGWAWDGAPVVSPDGSWVAYWHNLNTGASHRVTVARTDGSGTVVETGPRLEGTATYIWSPDSSKLLAYPNDATTARVYVLDPGGGDWTTVPWQSTPGFDWQRAAMP